MSREHPILFKPEMVRAILDGRKTQTRRVIIQNNHKPPTDKFVHFLDSLGYPASEGKLWAGFGNPEDPVYVKCPYDKVGDRLWVRETWRCTGGGDLRNIIYKAEGDTALSFCGVDDGRAGILKVPEKHWAEWDRLVYETTRGCNWRSPIHMYKWAARIWIEITGIRVERVQDISEGEVLREGCIVSPETDMRPFVVFRQLWDSINAKRWQRWQDDDGNWHRTFVDYGWDKNPWVWVIEFKKQAENERRLKSEE